MPFACPLIEIEIVHDEKLISQIDFQFLDVLISKKNCRFKYTDSQQVSRNLIMIIFGTLPFARYLIKF